MTFKLLKCTINHKTNKQKIEYRIYSDENTFKTCSPRKWLALNLEDRTTNEELDHANTLLIFAKIGDSINKQVDINVKVKNYVSQSLSRQDAYYDYAVQNGIAQYEKRLGKVVIINN